MRFSSPHDLTDTRGIGDPLGVVVVLAVDDPLDPAPLPAIPVQLIAADRLAERLDLARLTMPHLAADLVEAPGAVLEEDVPLPRFPG